MKKCYFLMFIISFCISSFAQTTTSTQSIKVETGWNLMSLPVSVIDSTKSTLFPTAVSDAFIFQNSYLPKDTLNNGYGFWLKFYSAETISIIGSITTHDTIAVHTGWNMIGGISTLMPVDLIMTDPPGIRVSDYFGFNTSYNSTDTLQPGFGYWVKVSQNGHIILWDASTRNGVVAIDTNEIGGSDLRLVSCFAEGRPSTGDSLSTQVSIVGNQLLMAVDGDNKVRALTLSIPHNSIANILKLDAFGTAATMIFMTPGISTTDTNEFNATLANITSLSGFTQFHDYLRQRLDSFSLDQIVADSLCDSLLADCVNQYIELYPSQLHVGILKNPTDEKNHFELTQTDIEQITHLAMTNKSWRYVTVVRRDLDQNNTLIDNIILIESMGGVIPYSWGSIFTWTMLTPTNANSQFNFSPNVGSSELWIRGLSLRLSSNVPSDIQSIDYPWGQTLLYYLAFPVLDLYAGASTFLAKSARDVNALAFAIKEAQPTINTYKLLTATTPRSQGREAINLAVSLMSAGITAGALPEVAALGPWLAVSSMIFAGANGLVFALAMAVDEPYTKFQLDVPPPCGTMNVPYEGKTYHTVQIGNQCWLKENLDVGSRINGSLNQTNNGTIEKYCYDDDSSNCTTYGGLYQWNEAMQYSKIEGVRGICPSGWHIPTFTDFNTLATTENYDGNALKDIGQGTGRGVGTNTSGFSALLAGCRNYDDGSFHVMGSDVYFWSSTEYSTTYANHMDMIAFDSGIGLYHLYKNFGVSVRCIKD